MAASSLRPRELNVKLLQLFLETQIAVKIDVVKNRRVKSESWLSISSALKFTPSVKNKLNAENSAYKRALVSSCWLEC